MKGIYNLRRKMGLSQVEFSKIMKVSPAKVYFWEIGKEKPQGMYSLSKLARMARTNGMNFREIVS